MEVKIEITASSKTELENIALAFKALSGASLEQKQELGTTDIVVNPKDVEKPKKAETKKQEKAETKKQEKAEVEEPKKSSIKISEVRQLVADKRNNHRAAIKEKLISFGAESVTKLPEEHYGEFVEFLSALK